MGSLCASPFCVVVMKVTARSLPAKGWPCLMKTDEAEIKCLPTLRDSFITVSPRAIEHLGLELSFNRPCLTAPWWHTAAFQAHAHLHLYLSFPLHSLCFTQIYIYIYKGVVVFFTSVQIHKVYIGFISQKRVFMEPLSNLKDLGVLAGPS